MVTYSNEFLLNYTNDQELYLRLRTYRGIGFVLFASVIIYLLGTFNAKSLKAFDKALLAEEAKVKRLMETSPTGIIYVNDKGIVTYSNTIAEDLLKLPHNFLRDKHIDELISELNKSNSRPITSRNFVISRVIRTKKAIWDRKYNVRSGSDYRLISMNASPVLSAKNEMEGILCTVMDVTDDLPTEQKGILYAHKERYKLLVDETPFGVLILEDNIIRYANPASIKLFSAEKEADLVGKNPLDLIHPSSKEEMRNYREEFYSGEKDGLVSISLISLSGREIPAEVITIPFRATDAIAEQIIIVDVTERLEKEKELEQNLKEKNMLLTEMHHRVKNNLAIISGLIQLEAFETKNETVKAVLAGTTNRIKTIAYVHEQIYASENYSTIELNMANLHYAKDLVKSFTGSADIDINFDINPAKFNLVEAMSAALFINEAINSLIKQVDLKYKTGEEKLMIDFSIQQEDKVTQIEICLNLPRKSRVKGKAFNKTLSNQIIEMMAEQLSGDLEIIDTEERIGFKLIFAGDKVAAAYT